MRLWPFGWTNIVTTHTTKFRKRGRHSLRDFLALSMRIGSNVFGNPLEIGIDRNGHSGNAAPFYSSATLDDMRGLFGMHYAGFKTLVE